MEGGVGIRNFGVYFFFGECHFGVYGMLGMSVC